jgi:hypothetical protein
MRSVETIPRVGWGIKENGGESEFKYDILDIRTVINVPPAQ